MARPSRTRRILKWTGVGLSMIVIACWAISLFFRATILLTKDSAFVTGQGVLAIVVEEDIGLYTGMSPGIEEDAWSFRLTAFRQPAFGARWVFHGMIMLGKWYVLPYWMLLLLTAIPTAWLWHRDRRRIRPGCCLRCGYDLTGNISGVCSECGLPKQPPATV